MIFVYIILILLIINLLALYYVDSQYVFISDAIDTTTEGFEEVKKRLEDIDLMLNKYNNELLQEELTDDERHERRLKKIELGKKADRIYTIYNWFHLNFIIIENKYKYKHLINSKYKDEFHKTKQTLFKMLNETYE